MTRENIRLAVKDSPEEFHLDELFEKLAFIDRIEAARQQVENGQVITQSEMKSKILEWRKSA